MKNDKPFVFIIDEINRGEISKIFGDLFKKGFFVPDNVYIIGTMNDIDRSVESMDFAFRRRFAFKEVTADDSMQMHENSTCRRWRQDAHFWRQSKT